MAADDVTMRRRAGVDGDGRSEHGMFRPGDPVDRPGGPYIVAEPRGRARFTAIQPAKGALRAAVARGRRVRVPPVARDAESEPDVAAMPDAARHHRDAHPTRPVPVVTVAGSILATDRGPRGTFHTRAGVRGCWLVDLLP